MSSQAQINKLAERYPFDEEELEQLIRCHSALLDTKNADTFLTKIALSSPYSYFFLPGNEMRRRIELIEDKILPFGFGSCIRAAMSVDLFVDCANEGDLSLERFLEGVADCGQRGHKDALRVIWDCCSYLGEFEDKLDPAKIVDLCYRLAFAAGTFLFLVHISDQFNTRTLFYANKPKSIFHTCSLDRGSCLTRCRCPFNRYKTLI